MWRTALRRLRQRVPWKPIGFTLALTPVVAVAQGAFLLYDYRAKHGHAPHPDIPSSGLVVVGPDHHDANDEYDDHHHHNSEYLWFATQLWNRHHTNKRSSLSEQQQPSASASATVAPPLRLLVLGDSLAAGVGTSQSSTPVLPETIARALSKALGGRAVYWDCVGAPGQSASQIVEDIHQLHLLPPAAALFRRLRDWQAEQRQRAQDRLETARRRTQEWLEHRRMVEQEEGVQHSSKDNDNTDSNKANKSKNNRVVRWWMRTTQRIRRDWDEFRNILKDDESAERREAASASSIVRRHSTRLDPQQARQYDVAVVLTGLNDLKDSYLPFMRQGQPKRQKSELIRVENDATQEEGLKGQLIRILDALEDKMRVILPMDRQSQHQTTIAKTEHGTESDTAKQDSKTTLNSQSDQHHGLERVGPLIVFPGLPYQTTDLNRYPPLSWFLAPLLDAVDRNKQMIAERFPDLVLYVAPPDLDDISNAEAKRGAQWQDFQILLNLNDVAHDVKEKLERLMRQHYKKYWIRDAAEKDADTEYLYVYSDVWGVTLMEPVAPRPGKTMVAPDGIHPSDSGYDMWGRHIAGAIVLAWEQRRATDGRRAVVATPATTSRSNACS